ncbi:MAG: class I SAM-dependent methyltransferase [Patescibacteria group bacterium]|jgi:SAM-dependent methyltransferase
MKVFNYNGKMEFQTLNDSEIRANYQHKYVVDKYLPYIKGRKVLDAGCWTGTMAKQISISGIDTDYTGIDVNDGALGLASRAFPKFSFVRGVLDDPSDGFIQSHKSSFDTVIFLDVIEHVKKGSETLVFRSLNSLLKPGGYLILSTMLSHPLNFIDPAWFFGHRHYPLVRVTRMIDEGGFEPIETSMLGNIYWDLDLLLLYIYKHVFRRQYKTPLALYNLMLKGLKSPQRWPTRIYVLVKKRE